MKQDAIELLKELGNLGYEEDTVEIAGFKVTLRVLSAEEESEMYSIISDYDGFKWVNENKIHTLARSIIKINDAAFDHNDIKIKNVEEKETVSDEEKEQIVKNAISARRTELIDKKIEIIRNSWPASIIDELWNFYTKMINKVEKKLAFKKEETK